MSTEESTNYYQKDELTLKQILIFLYSGKWFFIVIMMLTAFSTYSYIKTITPIFEANIQYRVPSEIIVSKINKARFDDNSLIKESSRKLSAQEIFEMFSHHIFSSSFREKVFREKGYMKRVGFNESQDLSDIYSFVNGVKIDKSSSSSTSSYLYFRGANPSILSNFLNDLILEANKATFKDLKQIEANLIETQVKVLSTEINRREKIEKDKINLKIDQLKTHLSVAKKAKMNDMELEKISVVFENLPVNIHEKDFLYNASEVSSTFPLWYLFGEDFINLEIEQLISINDPTNSKILSLKAAVESINSFDINLGGFEVVDITWSILPRSPEEPKKKLILAVLMSLSFLLSIFIWYVLAIFRSKK
jgi:LPS O-antigen subunit length determinant protein (WzzB/FepE family)